jgi:tripartite-type tricarboxylate transporter receptor subunit TctC
MVLAANHPERWRFAMRKLLAMAAILVAAFGCDAAWSQPQRSIKLVVPFPPAGVTDIVARLLAEEIGRRQGVSVLVENRPGAGSVIGTEVVSRAAPDGSTILLPANSFVINAILRKLSYDPMSFEPVCLLVHSPHVVTVNSASPYRTLADLLDAARAHPGTLTLASVGPATSQHIAFEQLKRAANVEMVFVPYAGNVPAVNALLGGHVTSVMVNYTDVAEQVKAGTLRALATSLRTRIEEMPDVPALAELGFKDFESETWIGLVAPPKTPKEMVAQLASWTTSALSVPEIKAKLTAVGMFPVGTCGADFAAYIRKQYDDYARVIRASNIKLE